VSQSLYTFQVIFTPETKGGFTVTAPLNYRELPIGTLRAISKQAKVDLNQAKIG